MTTTRERSAGREHNQALADRARHEVNADLTQALWQWRVVRTRVITNGGEWADAIWSYPPDSEECFEELWWDGGGSRSSWPMKVTRPWVWSWKGMRELHERLLAEDYMLVRLESSHWHGDYASIRPAHESQQRVQMRETGPVFGPDLPTALALCAHQALGFTLRPEWLEALMMTGED